MRERMRATVENEKLKIALQEAFELLKHLGDPIGARFAELGWDEKGSPLQVRNESIAGHGFASVLEKTTNEFLEGVLFFSQTIPVGTYSGFRNLSLTESGTVRINCSEF